LLNRIRNALKARELRHAQDALVSDLASREGLDCIIGGSETNRALKSRFPASPPRRLRVDPRRKRTGKELAAPRCIITAAAAPVRLSPSTAGAL